MAISDSIGLLLKIKADSSQATKELEDFNKDVKKHTDQIKSLGENAFGALAKHIGLSAEQTAGLGATLPAVGAGLSGVGTVLTGVVTVAVGAVSALAALSVQFFDLASKAAEYGDSIGDASDKVGVSVEALSALKFQADASGESFDALITGIGKFSNTVAKAAEGSKGAGEKLKRLGIEPSEALNDLDATLAKVIKRIVDIKNPIEQGAAASDAFGDKLGKNLLPLLKDFDGDLPALIEKVRTLGGILSDEDAKAAGDFEKAVGSLKAQINVLGIQIGKEFIPTFVDLSKKFSLFLTDNKEGITAFGKNAAIVFSDFIGLLGKVVDKAREYKEVLEFIARVHQTIDPLAGATGSYLTDVNKRGKSQVDASATITAPKKPQEDTEGYLQNIKEQEKLAKEREAERKRQEKADLSARITLLKNHLKDAEKAYDDSLKTLREKFKDAPNADAFAESYKQAAQSYAAEVTKISKQLEPLQKQQAEAEKKTTNEIKLMVEEQNKIKQDAYKKILDETDKNEKLLTETQQKESEKRLKFTQTEIKGQIDSREKATKAVISRIDANLASGAISESDALMKKQAAVATFKVELDKEGNAKTISLVTGLLAFKQQKLAEELQNVKGNAEEEVRVRKEMADLVTEANQVYYDQRKETAELDAKRYKEAAEDGKKFAEEKIRQQEAVLQVEKEVFQLEQDIADLQQKEARKLLTNIINTTSGNEKIATLIKLRDFDIAENERRFDAAINLALKEDEIERNKIKGLANEKQLAEALNQVLERKLDLAKQIHDADGNDNPNGRIINQVKKDSSLVSIFGGLVGGGNADTDPTDKIKSKAEYMKGVYEDLKTSTNAALGSMVGGLANLAQQWIVTGKFSVRAAVQMVAGILAALAIEDAVHALHEYATGIAMAANPFTAPLAAGHFAAAAAYGVAAAQAGGAAVAVGLISRIGANDTASGTATAATSSSSASSSASPEQQERVIEENRLRQARNEQTKIQDRKDTLKVLIGLEHTFKGGEKMVTEAFKKSVRLNRDGVKDIIVDIVDSRV